MTAAELEPTRAASRRLRLLHAAASTPVPTGALDEPGVLDATACLSYWTQVPDPIPERYRAPLGAQVYGCDICQDVCPWNRGVERRRAGLRADAPRHVDLLAWLADGGAELDEALRRLYVPRNDPRWLRRNAIVALGNLGDADGGDPGGAAAARGGRRRAARRACALGARAAGGACS